MGQMLDAFHYYSEKLIESAMKLQDDTSKMILREEHNH